MDYKNSVIDLIKKRRSCRSFDERLIEPEKIDRLEDFIESINCSAPIKSRFVLALEKEEKNTNYGSRGSYSSVFGSSDFIIGILDKSEKNAEKFGYQFERIVLFATDLGLDTCWMGAFNRGDFEKKTELSGNEYIPIICPVGYSAEKRRLDDIFVRTMAMSDNRKSWDKLFSSGASGKPLTKEEARGYEMSLEMVRLAPSASNKQPWRIIMKNGRFDFYLKRNVGYGLLHYDIQKNDIGIAMCHFELTAKELKLPGGWSYAKQTIPGLEYIASWETE